MDTAVARKLLMDEARRLDRIHDLVATHLTQSAGEAGDRTPTDPDGAGLASSLLETEIETALLHSVDAECADLAHALARLADGTYGTCEGCGGTIPDARLESVPATRFCVTCEADQERDATTVRAAELDPARRAALRDLDDWTDDGDTPAPAAEEVAVHATSSPAPTTADE